MNRDLEFEADHKGLGFKMPLVPGESSIKDGVVEGSSIATCRICHKSNGTKDDNLISPCMCNGAQQFVHRSCLDHYRSVKEDFDFSHCTTCKARFHLRVAELDKNSWRKIKFRLIVARDIFLIVLAVQIVTGLIGGLAYLADKDGSFRNSFTHSWIGVLSTHPIPFYYCLGFLVFLVLFVVIGFILFCCCFNEHKPSREDCFLWCDCTCFPFLILFVIIFGIMAFCKMGQRHFRVLTKRELTKEYVVEDLRWCYTPAQLEVKHMERLKMLELW